MEGGQQNRFKPCYKWTAFNTSEETISVNGSDEVLNLIITGLPSILTTAGIRLKGDIRF